ncbi:MAG: GNAT family N-acetyltransferase [Fulvivirga sp.]
MKITINKGSIDDAVYVQGLIPEFVDAYPKEEYFKRLTDNTSLILIATENESPVGFKVGYALDHTTFYSWMGGIIPTFRKQSVAQKLAQHQEEWARANGFERIRFKTRNYLKPMLIFALKNGFQIIEVNHHKKVNDHRIILEKQL